ncbi:phospho-sugar mutase, partial [Cellulomonas hominis]|nr:phospho-sugar mutase [Cellulomonas hominis]
THGGPGAAASDGWRMLHGDETGALLGSVAAERFGTPGTAPADDSPVLANSIVSSRLLSRIAAHAGLRHAQTLTGFKWISRVDGLVFGYEEALGYCVDPAHVRDKDGISAALTLAGLAARLKVAGRTPVDVLDDLARRHGLHLTDQLSARFTDLSQIPETMQRLREHPPVLLAGSPVMSVVDLAAGSDADRGGLPPTDGIRLLSQDDTRVIVRPSGTEPKVKCYLEVVVPVEEHASAETVGAARAAARDRLDRVRADVAAALGI